MSLNQSCSVYCSHSLCMSVFPSLARHVATQARVGATLVAMFAPTKIGTSSARPPPRKNARSMENIARETVTLSVLFTRYRVVSPTTRRKRRHRQRMIPNRQPRRKPRQRLRRPSKRRARLLRKIVSTVCMYRRDFFCVCTPIKSTKNHWGSKRTGIRQFGAAEQN